MDKDLLVHLLSLSRHTYVSGSTPYTSDPIHFALPPTVKGMPHDGLSLHTLRSEPACGSPESLPTIRSNPISILWVLTHLRKSHRFTCTRYSYLSPGFVVLAERVGFEPTEQQAVHRISSPAHSTTLAPLRNCFPVEAANDTSEDSS